jgi:hypothetical protein
MKKSINSGKVMRKAFLSLLFAGVMIYSGCDKKQESLAEEIKELDSPPPAVITQNREAEKISDPVAGAKVAGKAMLVKNNDHVKLEKGSTVLIHFGDRNACTWNPNICNNTFVVWPGYIQNTGYNEWGYAWMSRGPGAGFIPYGTGDHFHIMGFLFPDLEPNPCHTAMFGNDWFAFYMQKNGVGRINFDLTQIKVKGTVPITLWFKAANDTWWYWPSVGPGWWNLPGAGNIKEFHIRAASGLTNDKYSIDDIQVKGL